MCPAICTDQESNRRELMMMMIENHIIIVQSGSISHVSLIRPLRTSRCGLNSTMNNNIDTSYSFIHFILLVRRNTLASRTNNMPSRYLLSETSLHPLLQYKSHTHLPRSESNFHHHPSSTFLSPPTTQSNQDQHHHHQYNHTNPNPLQNHEHKIVLEGRRWALPPGLHPRRPRVARLTHLPPLDSGDPSSHRRPHPSIPSLPTVAVPSSHPLLPPSAIPPTTSPQRRAVRPESSGPLARLPVKYPAQFHALPQDRRQRHQICLPSLLP